MGGSLACDELQFVLRLLHYTPAIFIETGTYKGETTANMTALFDRVISMELSPVLYKSTVQNLLQHFYNSLTLVYPQTFDGGLLFKEYTDAYKSVHLLLGDSVKYIPYIADRFADTSSVWFLDAHQSGHDTTNNGIWVPLEFEIRGILEFVRAPQLLVIDDVRLFENAHDWAHVSLDAIRKWIIGAGFRIDMQLVLKDRFYVSIVRNG